MGIDYGRKRTGVAVTDPLQIVAGNLATVPTHTLMQFIKDYIVHDPVDRIVVGKPTQLNGEPSESMKYITPFVNRLKKELPDMPVVMYDERFTSTIAHQAMIDGGMTSRVSMPSQRPSSLMITCKAYTINQILNL